MSPARPDIQPPKLAGYTYLDRLGSGGFSDVFLYEREFPKQKVAIKVLISDAVDEGTSRRFTAEANAMASLSTHPYIVTIYEAAVSPQGFPFLVMEYYPRPNFSVRSKSEKFSVAAVLRVGIQVAAAIETAHRGGILHRDIKPANILTSEYGRPGLTDFGIASADDGRDEEAEGMSIPWSPPEVVAGSGKTDERADVYSLAATLYTFLAGRSPFELATGSNRSIDLIDRIERAPVPPIERADVPGSLQRLLAQCMAKDPSGRPASAAQLARSLQVIEVEQRFDMTPFEVSEANVAAPAGEPIDPEAGATRMKGPAVIQTQAPASQASAPRTTDSTQFRPAESVTRTFVRAPGSKPTGVQSGLIHNTPYQPSAVPAQPVVPSANQARTAAPGNAGLYTDPSSGVYTAPQPIAAPKTSSGRVPIVAASVGAVVIALIGAWFLIGPGQAKPPPKKVTAPVVTRVNVKPCPAPNEIITCVTWESDTARKTDSFEITYQGSQEPQTMTGGALEQRFPVSPDPVGCATVTPERKGVRGNTVKSLIC
ncbi:MAG: protein kinase [Actinomycetes bacterium]